MAEGNSSNPLLDEVDEAYVTCQICLNVFNDAERKPKYLVCHHYFCLGCTQALVKEDSIVCPLCRVKTKVTGGLISQLTTNTIILRLLEKMNPTGKPLNIDHSILAPTAKLWCTVCAQDARFCSSSGTHNLLNSETLCKEMLHCFHQSRDDLKSRCSNIAQKVHANKNRLEGVLEALGKIKDAVQTELDSCQLGLETLEYLLLDGDQLPEPSSADVQACKAELSRTVADLDKLKREAGVVGFITDEKVRPFQLVEKHHLLMELTRTVGKESPAKLPQALHNLPLTFEAKHVGHYPVLLQDMSSTSTLPAGNKNSSRKDGGKKLVKATSSSLILPGGKDKQGKTLPSPKRQLSRESIIQTPTAASRIPAGAFERTAPMAGVNVSAPLSRASSVKPRPVFSNQAPSGASTPSPLNTPMEFSELLELLNRSQGNNQQRQQQAHEDPSQAITTARATPSSVIDPADPNHCAELDDSDYLIPNSLALPQSPPPIPDRLQVPPSRPVPRPRKPAVQPELPPRPGRTND